MDIGDFFKTLVTHSSPAEFWLEQYAGAGPSERRAMLELLQSDFEALPRPRDFYSIVEAELLARADGQIISDLDSAMQLMFLSILFFDNLEAECDRQMYEAVQWFSMTAKRAMLLSFGHRTYPFGIMTLPPERKKQLLPLVESLFLSVLNDNWSSPQARFMAITTLGNINPEVTFTFIARMLRGSPGLEEFQIAYQGLEEIFPRLNSEKQKAAAHLKTEPRVQTRLAQEPIKAIPWTHQPDIDILSVISSR